jgi:hypothetical protein
MGAHKNLADGLLMPLWSSDPPASAVDALMKVFDDYFKVKEAPRSLTHYTTAEGLLGLLKESSVQHHVFWASLVTHLNDFSELLHGQELISNLFLDFSKDAPEFFPEELRIDWQKELAGDQPWTNIYSVSFSEESDSLGQWRGYGGTRGYALTFSGFERVGWSTGSLLAKVAYDNDTDRMRRALVDLLQFYKDHCPRDRPDVVRQSLKRGLALVAATFKREAFAAEREWRLVLWCEESGCTRFRPRTGRLLPYHDVSVPKDVFKLTAIKFGPGFHDPTELAALRMLKRRLQLDDSVDIDGTQIPYRID